MAQIVTAQDIRRVVISETVIITVYIHSLLSCAIITTLAPLRKRGQGAGLLCVTVAVLAWS